MGTFYKHPLAREAKGPMSLKQKISTKFFSAGLLKGLSVAVFSISVILGGVLSQISPTNATPAPLTLGELPYQKMLSQNLTDRSGVLINVANGNVVLKTQDLTVKSPGPDLSITHYHNSRAAGSGQVGAHGTLSVGADITITPNANGSATYQSPSGFKVTFPSDGSGGYTTPPEFTAATLTKVTGGGWKLTYHKSGDAFIFSGAGKQIKHANATGLAITYVYSANGTLATATDAQGKVTTFSDYSGTKVGKITDPAGRTVEYQYNASGQLTDVTGTNSETWITSTGAAVMSSTGLSIRAVIL